MCEFNDAELNWVSTAMWRKPELMAFEMGMSMSRYFPPIGTAGLARCMVNGYSR
jgi:hypothetical protein